MCALCLATSMRWILVPFLYYRLNCTQNMNRDSNITPAINLFKHSCKWVFLFIQSLSVCVLSIGMDELMEVSFSPIAATGKPLSRCGKCHRYMKYIQVCRKKSYQKAHLINLLLQCSTYIVICKPWNLLDYFRFGEGCWNGPANMYKQINSKMNQFSSQFWKTSGIAVHPAHPPLLNLM